MRSMITTMLLCLTAAANALTIPQGSLYFDNSKTQYSQVTLVYGSDQRAETYALAMSLDGNKWRVDIPQQVNDMYRFTFVGGTVRQGLHTTTFSTFKDSISHQAGLNRTATSEAQMSAGDIFVPQTADNWAQGSWMNLAIWQAEQDNSQPGQAQLTGTLPVVYLTTEAPIVDKENYITSSLYIDPLSTGYKALGSAEAPITGLFKGRGNWTWNGFDKKPYRIKLDSKQEVLGMPKNKHWCLIAHADDNLGFLKNATGFMLSEHFGMRWTPRMVPVELVMNGKYQGLYFLTEHVRADSKRVNITEQEDQATDSVSGGWLIEIDNYQEAGNIEFDEGNGQHVMITPKVPEVLSDAQRQYITDQIHALNNALYGNSASTLFGMLDVDEAAKYYLVQEILEDCESYHGSCYLYKDRDRNGQVSPWFFGPVWDFGNAYNRMQERWIYDGPIWPQYWIGQLATWPEFQDAVKQQWWIFYHDHKDAVRAQISEFAALITQAAKNDATVWRNTQNYCDNSNMAGKTNDFLQRYDWRVNWLFSQYGEGTKPNTWDNENVESKTPTNSSRKVLKNGQLLIERNGQIYDLNGRLVY